MGQPSNNIADLAHDRMHALLHGDRLAQYKQEFAWDNAAVGAWIKSNVLHVHERCPNVYRTWKKGGHSEQKQALEFRQWLHAALIGALTPLPPPEKTRILQGKTQNDMEASFYQEFQKDPLFWHELPPSWTGRKDSELRRAAEALGWKTSMSQHQIESAWSEELSGELSSLAYPHCLRVIKAFADNERNATRGLAPHPVVIAGMGWGKPEDVTLAQHLIAHSPWQSIVSIVPHPNTPALPQEASDALKSVVITYAVLGNRNELLRSIVRGKLPAMGNVEQFALPDLDGPAH